MLQARRTNPRPDALEGTDYARSQTSCGASHDKPPLHRVDADVICTGPYKFSEPNNVSEKARGLSDTYPFFATRPARIQ